MIAGGAGSTGGLAAIAIKTFGAKTAADSNTASTQGRNPDGNEHD